MNFQSCNEALILDQLKKKILINKEAKFNSSTIESLFLSRSSNKKKSLLTKVMELLK